MGCGGSSLKGDLNSADIGGDPAQRRSGLSTALSSTSNPFSSSLDDSNEIHRISSLSHSAYNTTESDSTSAPPPSTRASRKIRPSFASAKESSSEIHKERSMNHGGYNMTEYDETATSPPPKPNYARKVSFPFSMPLETTVRNNPTRGVTTPNTNNASNEIHRDRALSHSAYNTTVYDTSATEPASVTRSRQRNQQRHMGRYYTASQEISQSSNLDHGAYNTTTYDMSATSPGEASGILYTPPTDQGSEIMKSSRWFASDVKVGAAAGSGLGTDVRRVGGKVRDYVERDRDMRPILI